jgi:hypothetical protein
MTISSRSPASRLRSFTYGGGDLLESKHTLSPKVEQHYTLGGDGHVLVAIRRRKVK